MGSDFYRVCYILFIAYSAFSLPTKTDFAADLEFEKYLDIVEPLATPDEVAARKSVISDIQKIVNKWVQEVSIKQGFTGESLRGAAGKIFTFGSFRLGLITPASDIDALCVAPKHISREDFFASLQPILEANSHVTELSGVPDAVVPIIKMKYKGTEVDLTFARLNLTTIDSKLDTLESNNLLKHLDEKTVRSINGTRVADMLLSLVPRPETYRQVLRFIRHWAKKRGLYSNAIGFFGGITWAILCARVCQMYPNLTPLTTSLKFFLVFSRWNWSNPVILCPISQSTEVGLMGFKIWNPKLNHSDRSHLMPIITPAFPCMNSTYNVSQTTKRILISEFARAAALLGAISVENKEMDMLAKTVRPPPFLSLHHYFLVVELDCRSESAYNKLKGFVESRLRILLKFLEHTPGVMSARPWPGDFPTASSSCFWLIGLSFPPNAVVDLRKTIAQFHEKIFEWNEKPNFAPDDWGMNLFHVSVDSNVIKGIESATLKNKEVLEYLKTAVPEEQDLKRQKIAIDVK